MYAVSGLNPLLIIVTLVALARAFHKARQTGEYASFVDGQLKGGIGAGTTLAAYSYVVAATGPVGVALLTALCAGILTHKATKNVSVVQIAEFMAERAKAASIEMKKLADSRIGTS